MSLFATSLFDFFLPRVCVSCDARLTPIENSICEKCFSNIKSCEEEFLQSEFDKKFKEEKIITEFLSLFIFEDTSPIRDLLHGLKYDKKFRLGYFLGKLLAANFDIKIKKWDVDLIIPVPLHGLKKAERGFNQSYYISKGLSKNKYFKTNPFYIDTNKIECR